MSYKWVVLINTTSGVLIATIDASIVLIAMPAIFRGIHLDPLAPGNTFFLLWMMLGYMIVTSVLVVNFGRIGDMFGRVRMYNLGFLIFTLGSILLSIDWMTGRSGAMWLIAMRLVQGVGGAFIGANSSAIITDTFPADQRGLALGINNVAFVAGRFLGLVVGGVLASIDWRLVFFVSVPFGVFGTLWGYFRLEERGVRVRSSIDWPGNVTFAVGLVMLMIGITSGIQPYGKSLMSWTRPTVLAELAGGVTLLVAFAIIETRVQSPMFRLQLLRIRAYAFGSLSGFLSSLARGGLMFMLIIWLQGIWLPLHGVNFESTPLWAGLAMLPLSAGVVLAGPLSGYLSDRFGARPFATGGMLASALSFVLLASLPTDFSYPVFAVVIFIGGIGVGAFGSPNRAAIMNSLPHEARGAGGGMNTTFQNSAQILSIGVFFTLMILGLSKSLPSAITHGLASHGVDYATVGRIAHLPPVSILFAAFLGYNPLQHLIGRLALSRLPASAAATLTSHTYFPGLISPAFRSGLHIAFGFAVAACLIGAVASWSRGARVVPAVEPEHVESEAGAAPAVPEAGAAPAVAIADPVEGG